MLYFAFLLPFIVYSRELRVSPIGNYLRLQVAGLPTEVKSNRIGYEAAAALGERAKADKNSESPIKQSSCSPPRS